MFYKKKEEYRFAIPREHSAYLAFKDRLKEMGIKYTEEGGHSEATIIIYARGYFDIDDTCDILGMVKGD